jgi:type II secretory pathway pseudopilin PulG
MKSMDYRPYPNKGLTLIEMTIVLMILMALLGTGVMVFRGVNEWKLGRTAAETVRTVHSAQRMFLADHPTHLVEDITPEKILPYLPGNPTSMPTVESLEGVTLSIIVDVSPPVIDDGAGNAYDPSGNPKDSLWDVGE